MPVNLYDTIAAAVLILAAAAVLFGFVCLALVRGKLQVHMAVAVATFCGTLLAWGGGNWFLGLFGLTWRAAVVWTFALLLFFSGIWGLVCDVRCLRYLLRQRPAVRVLVTLAAAAASVTVLAFGGLLGAVVVAFSASPEQVIVWEGQRVVESNESFMDPSYAYYAYHGPFVRGRERLFWRERPVTAMEKADAGDHMEIHWDGRVYAPFCIVSKEDCRERLGYIYGDPDIRINAYLDCPPECWLVEWIPQDGGALLYKELSTTDIPEGLETEYRFWESLP